MAKKTVDLITKITVANKNGFRYNVESNETGRCAPVKYD